MRSWGICANQSCRLECIGKHIFLRLVTHRWQGLAERTTDDLAILHRVYPGRGTDQIDMRRAIKIFQANYFEFVAINNEGVLIYETNARANELSRKLRERYRVEVREQEGRGQRRRQRRES